MQKRVNLHVICTVYTHAHTHIRIHARTHARTHTHTHTHIRIHTHTHTQTQAHHMDVLNHKPFGSQSCLLIIILTHSKSPLRQPRKRTSYFTSVREKVQKSDENKYYHIQRHTFISSTTYTLQTQLILPHTIIDTYL